MQPKEQKPMPGMSDERFAGTMQALERDLAKERTDLKSLWTGVGDIARDIGTANNMARDIFEGEGALMRTARGALSTGVGVGLELAMKDLWDDVWAGNIPYFEKLKFGKDVGKRLHEFSQSKVQPFDWKAKLAYLIKEGTEDLSIVGVYNFIAFRTQPILQKAETKHVLGTLALNTGELLFAPDLKEEMDRRMDFAQAKIKAEADVYGKKMEWEKTSRDRNAEDLDIAVARQNWDRAQQNLAEMKPAGMIGSNRQRLIRSLINVSNPVTMLGLDMMWSGVTTLVTNFKEVRRVREEKGGLKGREVYMPKKDKWEDKKPWEKKPWEKKPWEKKPYEDRRQGGQHRFEGKQDRVYYGRGDARDEISQEEYDLKMDS